MLARIKHQLSDGEVLLAIENGGTRIVRISEHEAKRLAWALLSDLDPTEVPDSVFDDPDADIRQMDKSQCELALGVLSSGPTTTWDVANRIGTTRNQAAVVLNRAKERGLVSVLTKAKVTMGFGRTQNVWQITDAGKFQLHIYDQVNMKFAAE